MSAHPQTAASAALGRRLARLGLAPPPDEVELVAGAGEAARATMATIRGVPAAGLAPGPRPRPLDPPAPDGAAPPAPGAVGCVGDAARALRERTVSAVELVEAALDAADRLDDRLGVFVARFDASARHAARRADAELARGRDRGPLHGIPVGIKDLFATSLGPTTAQSTAIDPAWGGGRDAAAVALLRAAGAIVVGTTTLSEHACGFADCDARFAVPRNPWDLDAWAGGSSGGSAGGVAGGLFLAALGTDTAGSIRIPAGFCGVTGLKPTQGRVQRAGCLPLSGTLDCVGPLARTARGCAALLDAIGPLGASSVPPGDVDLRGLRIGVDWCAGDGGDRDPEQPALLPAALGVLGACGAEVVEVELPGRREVAAASGVILLTEALAHHAPNLAARWRDYGRSTRLLLATGAWYSAGDHAEAQRVRRAGQRALARLWDDVDLVVTPMSALGAPPLAQLRFGSPAVGRMLGALHCDYWNAVDAPSLAVPIGFGAAGTPLAMQIAGPPFGEAAVLRAGAAYQQRTDWHARVPPLLAAAGP